MSGVATAMVVGSALQARAAKKGAQGAQAVQWAALDYQKDIRGETVKSLDPYTKTGEKGLSAYEDLLEDPSLVKETPGYEFGLSEGRRAIEQGAAAKGGLFSGQTLKRLMEYGSNYFSQQYDKALSRRMEQTKIGLGAEQIAAGQGGSIAATVGNTSRAMAGLKQSAGETQASIYGSLTEGLVTYAGSRR